MKTVPVGRSLIRLPRPDSVRPDLLRLCWALSLGLEKELTLGAAAMAGDRFLGITAKKCACSVLFTLIESCQLLIGIIIYI